MTESRPLGRFVGIGVGPGPARLLSVAAWEELQRCDLICYPRATSHESSAALHALDGLELPQAEWREISFEMSSDRDRLRKYYMELALSLRGELELGRRVGYLTLGDLMTYSTYGYLITALREIYPQLRHRTYAGITSFAAIAAHFDWPLGEGKERVLLLPCPEEIPDLRADILTHDLVVLMKIGRRLPQVLALLEELGITENCVFAQRLGFAEERTSRGLTDLPRDAEMGYLSTMLIRREAHQPRHQLPTRPLEETLSKATG